MARIVDQIEKLGLKDNTLIIFASDNGPTFKIGGADSEFFNSAMGHRGLKEEVYEGGIRVPLIARWPGHIASGSTSDFATVLYDLFPTFDAVAGQSAPANIDGISLVPTLTGKGEQKPHDYLYFEFASHGGQRAVPAGGLESGANRIEENPNAAVQLYDLASDPNEANDVAKEHPEIGREAFKVDEGSKNCPRWCRRGISDRVCWRARLLPSRTVLPNAARREPRPPIRLSRRLHRLRRW